MAIYRVHATALVFAALSMSLGVGAQPSRPIERAASAWSIGAPDASLAWFGLLAELRLPGAGAFAFVAPVAGSAVSPLARALASSRDFEVLHFVPLYYPSADRTALAAALRAAAATPVRAPAPRAALLVAALSNALPADVRREQLPRLASALEGVQVTAPDRARMAFWQARLDSLYVPALLPWLRAERLDAGRLVVSAAIGAEGRIFAGTTDRADNVVAVGTTPDDPDPEAALLAFVRELCFPAVTRAAATVREFNAADPGSARRASLAAVRCGADLMDRLLPARADAYRGYWLRRAESRKPIAQFDAVFPPDPALQLALSTTLDRVMGRRP